MKTLEYRGMEYDLITFFKLYENNYSLRGNNRK